MSKRPTNQISRSSIYGRQFGLGQITPTPEAANCAIQIPFSQILVSESVTWTAVLPLNDADLAATFGDTVNILDSPRNVPGIQEVESTFGVNGILQADMFLVGFGFHLSAEPSTFVQEINVLTPAPATVVATPVSPDVFTVNDVGTLGLIGDQQLQPGIMKWGHSAWQAAWHFVNAYRFFWTVCQRHVLVDELAANFSYYGPFGAACAASDSEVDVIEYAKEINKRYRQLNGGGIAVPINARRVGSVNNTGGGYDYPGNMGVFHPTRDFDTAPLTYGGLTSGGAQGFYTSNMLFHKFAKPFYLEKGLPIDMSFQVENEYHHQQFLRHMSISENQGGNLAVVNADVNLTSQTPVDQFPTPIMPELTLDPANPDNQFSNQQVTTTRVIMKGGVLKFSMLLKGFEVCGPWRPYICNNLSSVVDISAVTTDVNVGRLPR